MIKDALMRDTFILRMKTKEITSLNAFHNLMRSLHEHTELLCGNKMNKGKELEVCYLLYTEPLKLVEIKRMIDVRLNYEALELYEYVTW